MKPLFVVILLCVLLPTDSFRFSPGSNLKQFQNALIRPHASDPKTHTPQIQEANKLLAQKENQGYITSVIRVWEVGSNLDNNELAEKYRLSQWLTGLCPIILIGHKLLTHLCPDSGFVMISSRIRKSQFSFTLDAFYTSIFPMLLLNAAIVYVMNVAKLGNIASVEAKLLNIGIATTGILSCVMSLRQRLKLENLSKAHILNKYFVPQLVYAFARLVAESNIDFFSGLKPALHMIFSFGDMNVIKQMRSKMTNLRKLDPVYVVSALVYSALACEAIVSAFLLGAIETVPLLRAAALLTLCHETISIIPDASTTIATQPIPKTSASKKFVTIFMSCYIGLSLLFQAQNMFKIQAFLKSSVVVPTFFTCSSLAMGFYNYVLPRNKEVYEVSPRRILSQALFLNYLNMYHVATGSDSVYGRCVAAVASLACLVGLIPTDQEVEAVQKSKVNILKIC